MVSSGMPRKNESPPATKADMRRLAAQIDRLAREFAQTRTHLDQLLEGLDRKWSQHVDRILAAIEALDKRVQARDRTGDLTGHARLEHPDKLQ